MMSKVNDEIEKASKKVRWMRRWIIFKSKILWVIKVYAILILLAVGFQVVANFSPELREQMPQFYQVVDLILASVEKIVVLGKEVVKWLVELFKA